MPRRRAKFHEEAILNWHLDAIDEGTREYDLIYGISEEEDFNDLFATSFVSDEPELLCFMIGKAR